ncbi:30S ribosomal protein S12 methylthiotransferase RimO [Gottschalkiaceae bacterium SANA]|nr:30S ribosomal protein S12 methylthiotransferase RimO [Gottschalkiaceae bacterium SANA]
MNEYFYIETLGCSKNEVDSQQIAGYLTQAGYQVTKDPAQATFIIVNTCTFILDAKEDSIAAILNLADLKMQGQAKRLIVAGCLSQRYGQELLNELPEIDGLIGTGNLEKIIEAIEATEDFIDLGQLNSPYCETVLRVLPEKRPTRYVKIAEGCNKNCSYCIIPSIRGNLRSRTIESVQAEVEALVSDGAKEIILIAQDTTRFGADWAGRPQLDQLLKNLDEIDGDFWIRIFYMYPEGLTDKVLSVFQDAKHILPYFDLPLQHANNKVLKEMNRASNRESMEILVNKIRTMIPDAIIRTTFIVGFPGESESEFQELLDFVEQVPIDKVGVFPYSAEEGTTAAIRTDQIPQAIKLNRKERLMQKQMQISANTLTRWVGKEMTALIEEIDVEEEIMIGRTWIDAPEIDGIVVLPIDSQVSLGDLLQIRIVDTSEYDLRGEVL